MTVQLIDSVKNAVDYIISNENYITPPDVEVTDGSEAGTGYISKTYAISIKGDNGKVINLFIKYLPEIANNEWRSMSVEFFKKESKFYNEIYPIFEQFQKNKDIKEPFNNVPKHYTANTTNNEAPLIILENLKSLGYTLMDTKKPVDAEHLKLGIQAFARYHAISYAMKDQEPDLFQKLSAGIVDILSRGLKKFGIDDMVVKCVDQFLDSLDPLSDKETLDHCKNLSEVLLQHMSQIPESADEYAVICQGDCWANNMMFLYDTKINMPIEIKLLDWQCQRVNSPFLDFAYFFYTLATKEVLDNTEYFLNLYYDTLSQRIKELGSDPEKMYPYEIFLQHWRKYALLGLTMAFCTVKAQLFEKDEIPDPKSSTQSSPLVSFSVVLKHQDKYINRMKDLVKYFIKNKLLDL